VAEHNLCVLARFRLSCCGITVAGDRRDTSSEARLRHSALQAADVPRGSAELATRNLQDLLLMQPIPSAYTPSPPPLHPMSVAFSDTLLACHFSDSLLSSNATSDITYAAFVFMHYASGWFFLALRARSRRVAALFLVQSAWFHHQHRLNSAVVRAQGVPSRRRPSSTSPTIMTASTVHIRARFAIRKAQQG
jgi:hypothetical protein